MILNVEACREQFPALSRRVGDEPVVFLDGAAGSQVPQRVIDAVGDYLAHTNANHGGVFPTSVESDAILDAGHRSVADLLGADDPDEVCFGANMTTLTLALSRAMARTWQRGDEIVLTRLDHDANHTPWLLAARDAGVTVRTVSIDLADCTLRRDELAGAINARTRLVACPCAANSVGTLVDVAEVVRLAHTHGAEVFLDAVHYAPHRLIDVTAWDCDYLVCSAYKFFGPHVGVLWGRATRLRELEPYKLRPAPNNLPGRWMTGTQSHEGIAGVAAAVAYLADIGTDHTADVTDRRAALRVAFERIASHERILVERLLTGMAEIPDVTVYGITDPARMDQRVPTVGLTHGRLKPRQVAEQLARSGIFAWHGNFYALPLTEALGLEPEGMVRLSLLHYNTHEDVERTLEALRVL
ncbi:MAG: cysteine desulfurase-like protein [Pirellulales bacterium]